MAHCLVTGGAGFIGAHLVEGLLRRGHRVRVLDNFSTGAQTNVRAVQAQVAAEGFAGALEVVDGSILDQHTLATAMHGIEYVFHQAALPSVAYSVQEPLQSNRVNVEGTLCVLLAARDAGVKRLMYAGSSSAYGDHPELPKREDHPTNPLSPYALAKLTGEHYCCLFTQLYGLETVTLRYFNVFGPRQNPNSQYAAVTGRGAVFGRTSRRRTALAGRCEPRQSPARLRTIGQCRARLAAHAGVLYAISTGIDP